MKKLILITSAIVFLFSNLPAQVNLDSGLVAYYPFNGNANDESGNGNNGTVYGATLTTDRFGDSNRAYNFDGVDDYIKASSNSLPIAERTVSVWFYANTLFQRPESVILGYGGGVCGTSYYMMVTTTYFGMSSHCSVNSFKYNTTTEPIQDWYHFVISTGSDGTKIFVNSVEEYNNTHFINNTNVNGKDLSIGVDVNPSGMAPYTDSWVTYFNGMIDDIRIYNRALNQAEIDSLYNEIVTSIETLHSSYPLRFELKQNYPNPFNPSTSIQYAISSRQYVTLKVYDVLGNEIATLVNEEKPAGIYEVEFSVSELTSGIYFYKIQAGNFVETKKMVLLR